MALDAAYCDDILQRHLLLGNDYCDFFNLRESILVIVEVETPRCCVVSAW
jgi:hypothetical protein